MESNGRSFMRSTSTSEADQRVCAVCLSPISTGDAHYRIGDAEYHPGCFKSWLNVPMIR